MPLTCYRNLKSLYGDIHNHCAISYAHGSLADALANARQRLDFVSITGHAHWTDMPAPDERTQPIIDFHQAGFARLRAGWPAMLDELRRANREGVFTVFPAFEVHSCASGDRNILYRDLERPAADLKILYPRDLDDLHHQLRALREQGVDTLAQPHHIGYRKGTRGIDWSTFDPQFAPVVELISMHGCSEESDNTRPFLHVMGPSDYEGTMHYGLASGRVFGITGGTDHHSGHPGSYGHGLTGLWVEDGHSRNAIWSALYRRRSWAMTGDKIALRFAIDDHPMGSIIPHGRDQPRHLHCEVEAGGAIDYVDIIKNNRLIRRLSECDIAPHPVVRNTIRTKLHLEFGWGPRRQSHRWEGTFGISAGHIHAVEPRFRGRQVVSPLEADDDQSTYHTARILETGAQCVAFEAVSEGNPNNFTNATQGVCIHVEMPRSGHVEATLNGQHLSWPLDTLHRGARSGLMAGIESHAWRINRAPQPHELHYTLEFDDAGNLESGDTYYARVRQKNDQWAWSSPIFVRNMD
jgi:hypothetical protein